MSGILRQLEALKLDRGPETRKKKAALLERCRKTTFRTAAELSSYHELLLFLRVYADDPVLARHLARDLKSLPKRKDFRRVVSDLSSSGIAGADIVYPFFYPTALWLADNYPDQLTIAWDESGDLSFFESMMPLFAHYAETPGLDESAEDFRTWIDRMRGKSTDAVFLIKSFARIRAGQPVLEKLWDSQGLPLRLRSGRNTPTRTLACWPEAPLFFESGPLSGGRPNLREVVQIPPERIEELSPDEGRRFVSMAREAMVTRSRDLDAFAYGDCRDVRLIHCGRGLVFACIGIVPERRLLLESVYGFLTLQNGIPTGYVLTSALFGSSEIAFNVFETYRGGEAGFVYGRVLAMARTLFGSDSFTIYPYQLGQNNDEAINSGAWWFYRKMGFSPKDPETLKLALREDDRRSRNPAHRTPPSMLRKLADANLYWHLGADRHDVIGELPIHEVGLKVTRLLARTFAANRQHYESQLRDAALQTLDLGAQLPELSEGEDLSLSRWAPLILLMKGVKSWPKDERLRLFEILRAKGGRRESDFVRLFDGCPRVRSAIGALCWNPKTT